MKKTKRNYCLSNPYITPSFEVVNAVAWTLLALLVGIALAVAVYEIDKMLQITGVVQ